MCIFFNNTYMEPLRHCVLNDRVKNVLCVRVWGYIEPLYVQ